MKFTLALAALDRTNCAVLLQPVRCLRRKDVQDSKGQVARSCCTDADFLQSFRPSHLISVCYPGPAIFQHMPSLDVECLCACLRLTVLYLDSFGLRSAFCSGAAACSHHLVSYILPCMFTVHCAVCLEKAQTRKSRERSDLTYTHCLAVSICRQGCVQAFPLHSLTRESQRYRPKEAGSRAVTVAGSPEQPPKTENRALPVRKRGSASSLCLCLCLLLVCRLWGACVCL